MEDEEIRFVSLDSLVKQKIIQKPIKLIHLDIEGMEELG
jgi:hypothetical protein